MEKNFQVADSLSACKPFKEEFGNCKLANLKRCLVKVRVRVCILEMVIILNLEPLYGLFLTNIMVNIKVLKMGWEKEY